MDNAYHIEYAWHTHETLHGVFPKPVTNLAEPDAKGTGMPRNPRHSDFFPRSFPPYNSVELQYCTVLYVGLEKMVINGRIRAWKKKNLSQLSFGVPSLVKPCSTLYGEERCGTSVSNNNFQ